MHQESGPRPIVGPLNIHGILALAGVLGPLLLVIGDLTAAFTYPGYNMVRDSISSLAWTPMGWVQTIGFLAIGLLVEIFVAGLFFNIRGGRSFGFSAGLLVIFGFGLLLIGSFHTDAGSVHTIEGNIHGIATTIVFWLFPIAILLIAPSLRKDPHWKNLFVYTVVAGVLALALIVVVYLSGKSNWFGLTERILVANMIVWVEVMAIHLLRLSLHKRRITAETKAT